MTRKNALLGDCVDILSGYAFKSDRFNGEGRGLPLVRIRDVVPGESETFYDGPYEDRYLVSDGDILIGMDGEFNRAQWRGGRSLLNQRVCKIRPSSERLSDRYLFHILPQILKRIEDQTPFVTVKHLSAKDLRQTELVLPPIGEQRRIADILDRVDIARQRCEQAQREVGYFAKATFLEMFGDPASNPHGFSVEEIALHLSNKRAGTQSGPFGSVLKKHEYVDAGIPVWGVDNVQQNEFIPTPRLFITEGKFEQLERYRVLPGDILISRAGTVGRMCIAKPGVEKSIISTNLVRVVLDENSLLPEYFVSLFTFAQQRLGALKANNKDNAFTFLNPGTLRSLKIPIPPLDRQQEFKRLTEKIQGSVDRMNRQQEGLETLFSSLAQRAFSGGL